MSVKKAQLKDTPFFKNLTQSGANIKAARATLVAQQVDGVLTTKLQAIHNQINAVDLSLAQHEDLAATNTQSLVVASKDFDADGWLTTYHELLETKRLLKIDLDIYEEIERRQFGVEETPEDEENGKD